MLEKNFKKEETLYKNLKTIKGISHSSAIKICQQLGLNYYIIYNNISKKKLNKLSSILTNLKRSTQSSDPTHVRVCRAKLIDRNLKLITKENINKLIELNTYRGKRIKYGYPANGQRTSSNAKTAKQTKKLIKF